MKVELETIKSIPASLETTPRQVICPNCGGCLDMPDCGPDTASNLAYLNELENTVEKLHLMISDLNERLKDEWDRKKAN